MDPLSAASFASTVVIFIGLGSVSQIHETRILNAMGRNCEEVLGKAIKPPLTVVAAFETVQQRERAWFETMETLGRSGLYRQVGRFEAGLEALRRAFKLNAASESSVLTFALYKESVLLLRDLCSEIKTQQQLVDVGSAMARLITDLSGEEYENNSGNERDKLDQSINQNHDHSSQTLSQTQRGKTLQFRLAMQLMSTALEQVGQKEFYMTITVVVKQGSGRDGQTFKNTEAKALHTPGRLKLDSGANVDLVSMQFLTLAGAGEDLLVRIPEGEAPEIMSFQGETYHPEYQTELFWFREGEINRIQRTKFYVVKEAPFDLVLGSNKFVPEVTELARKAMWAVRPARSKEIQDLELQDQERERQKRILFEATKMDQELTKRFGPGPTSKKLTSHATIAGNQNGDIELGRVQPDDQGSGTVH